MDPRQQLFFDPDYPDISEDKFQQFDWIDFYQDAQEDIPLDMSEPRGNMVEIHCFINESHGLDKITQRLQTGILIFINKSPIMYYS